MAAGSARVAVQGRCCRRSTAVNRFFCSSGFDICVDRTQAMPALVQASAQFGAFRQQATLRPTRRGRAAVLRCTQAYLKQHQLEALQRTAEKWASGINNRDPDALCCTLSEKVKRWGRHRHRCRHAR